MTSKANPKMKWIFRGNIVNSFDSLEFYLGSPLLPLPCRERAGVRVTRLNTHEDRKS
jgi:hypothetical protein